MFQTDPLAIQSKGLQVKMSPNEKGYKSKCPKSKGPQKFRSLGGIKKSCSAKMFIMYKKNIKYIHVYIHTNKININKRIVKQKIYILSAFHIWFGLIVSRIKLYVFCR